MKRPPAQAAKIMDAKADFKKASSQRIGTHYTAKAFPISSPTGYTAPVTAEFLAVYRRENTYQVVGKSARVTALTRLRPASISKRQLHRISNQS